MDVGFAIEVQERPPAEASEASAPEMVTKPTGWTFQGGSSAGYDFQFGALLLGIEGDSYFAHAGIDHNIWDGQTYRGEFGGGWGTVRGRAGHTLGGVLLYGTGGVAIEDSAIEASDAAAGKTRAGWVVGGGAERSFTTNLSARIEFLRLDFGSFRDVGGASQPNLDKSAVDMLRVGFNYRF
ncbi:outer membrane protein [Blastochloris viridis]|nr:outer membrane beta-barrel protein [Blastochloris viridis]BAR99323.1 structural elements [Blastochloris viridis]